MTTKADTARAEAAYRAAYDAHRRAIAATVTAGDREGMAIEIGAPKRKLAQLERATRDAEAHEEAAEKAMNAALAAYYRAMADEVSE